MFTHTQIRRDALFGRNTITSRQYAEFHQKVAHTPLTATHATTKC